MKKTTTKTRTLTNAQFYALSVLDKYVVTDDEANMLLGKDGLVTLYRLRGTGLAVRDDGKWTFTPEGRRRLGTEKRILGAEKFAEFWQSRMKPNLAAARKDHA